ncbi:MAG: glycosyltransferase, partial [candidate division KSB1 bacterium]|nr:glycosyltransferase [candidate division KSB1 bacterium]
GHSYLIQAVARLPKQTQERIMVLIAGDGPLRNKLEQQAKQLGLNHVIKFLGYRTDIDRVLKQCQFNVVTSNQEGHCRVIIEAFRLGKPSIAFELDYVRESIHPNRSGLLVPLYDVDALARAIQFYVNHPEIAHQHGEFGRQWANDKFTMKAMFDRYRAVYLKLLNTNSKFKRKNR